MKTESDFKNSEVGSESISAIRDKRQTKHAKKREKRFSNATEKPREESKVVNSEEAQKTVKPLEKDAKMLLTKTNSVKHEAAKPLSQSSMSSQNLLMMPEWNLDDPQRCVSTLPPSFIANQREATNSSLV